MKNADENVDPRTRLYRNEVDGTYHSCILLEKYIKNDWVTTDTDEEDYDEEEEDEEDDNKQASRLEKFDYFKFDEAYNQNSKNKPENSEKNRLQGHIIRWKNSNKK